MWPLSLWTSNRRPSGARFPRERAHRSRFPRLLRQVRLGLLVACSDQRLAVERVRRRSPRAYRVHPDGARRRDGELEVHPERRAPESHWVGNRRVSDLIGILTNTIQIAKVKFTNQAANPDEASNFGPVAARTTSQGCGR